MRNTVIALAAAATLFAGTAQAQATSDAGNFYGNVGYSFLEVNLEGVDLGVIGGRVGYKFSPNLAVEGELGFGAGSEDFLTAKVKVDSTYGAFAVGVLPITENFELLGRVGYSYVKVSAKGFNTKVSADDGSFAFGAGAQYLLDENNGIRGDYTRYEEDGSGFNAFTVSYVRKF